MKYKVKEIIYTLQGEGAQTGRAAVFCRFAGCNLWSGREADRASAQCRFCDTDFMGTDGPGGDAFSSPEALGDAVASAWRGGADSSRKLVVCTGGEPLLQLDEPAISALHARGFEIAVETNGTRPLPAPVDWLTVSPKAGTQLAITAGNELKLVFPQPGLDPAELEDLAFGQFFLQPMDGPALAANIRRAVGYCLERPRWRLSLQTHKLLGIP